MRVFSGTITAAVATAQSKQATIAKTQKIMAHYEDQLWRQKGVPAPQHLISRISRHLTCWRTESPQKTEPSSLQNKKKNPQKQHSKQHFSFWNRILMTLCLLFFAKLSWPFCPISTLDSFPIFFGNNTVSRCQLSQLNAAIGWDLTGKTAVGTRRVAIKFSASNKNSLSGNRSHSASKNIDSFLLQQGD